MVMAVKTNAQSLARKYRNRAKRLDRAWARGIRNVLVAIENRQIKKLSGGEGAAPGSYPIPNRTHHLKKSTAHEMEGSKGGLVMNTAAYAAAIHEGWSDPERNIPAQPGRPFLQDAADETDKAAIMAVQTRRALA